MYLKFAVMLGLIMIDPAGAAAEGGDWIDLNKPEAWKQFDGGWQLAGSVAMAGKESKRLSAMPGNLVFYNGPKGLAHDLVTKQKFGDAEAHVEFLIPKGSNSGVKFHGHYEIQIFDSFGVKNPKADDCGGIYPRAELLPHYHHIDKGTPPRTNAAKPAGEWQTLDAVFWAPRFDGQGKKIANARMVKITLNGTVIHEDIELATPTGHAWHDKETAEGPLLLQGDHGAVAFRNVRIRLLKSK